MDDTGYRLIKHSGDKGFLSVVGNTLIKSLPVIIKLLAFVGTVALILVSGGIFVHNVDYLHHLFPAIPSIIKEFAAGFLVGMVMVALITGVKSTLKLIKRS